MCFCRIYDICIIAQNISKRFVQKNKPPKKGGGKDIIMSLIIPEKLPDCVDKPIENIASPISTNIGKTLGDLWFLALGGISQIADKKRIRYAAELEKLKKSLEEKVEAIPPERRVEPDTQTACQALEDAKYCAENTEIREMFANLIASTMDNQTCKNVHPSFSSILKQMTSDDAKFFRTFYYKRKTAICSFRLEYKSGGYSSLLEKVYFENENSSIDEASSNALTLSALERLGLIQTSLMESLANEKLYDIYKNSIILQEYKKEFDSDDKHASIKKGTAELTALGSSLLKICCPPAINIVFSDPTPRNEELEK